MTLNLIHHSTPPTFTPLAAAPWRSAAFLCAVGMASMLSACGGGGGGGPAYTIGGRVDGLADGQTIDLSQGTETITRSANGAFTFDTPISQGGSYEVKLSGAQPAWQKCNVSYATGSAVSANVSNVAVNCVSTDLAATGKLNDTGIDWCTENIATPSGWLNNAVCSAINWGGNLWGQQQDAFYGRDKRAKDEKLIKVGGGMAGFDYTKIGASGKVLVKQDEIWSDNGTETAGTQWDCVRDNVTGLVWEVKRNDATHLRNMEHRYAWYNPFSASNGGALGYLFPSYETDGRFISGLTCTSVENCNTHSYVTAVNKEGLCGKTDWRMPTVDELRSLAHAGRAVSGPTIDTDYFPNTKTNSYWSSLPFAIPSNSTSSAWSNSFSDNTSTTDFRNIALFVRLVRSGK